MTARRPAAAGTVLRPLPPPATVFFGGERFAGILPIHHVPGLPEPLALCLQATVHSCPARAMNGGARVRPVGLRRAVGG